MGNEMRKPVILATGSYVPERVVTNAEVDALLGAGHGPVAARECRHPRTALDGARADDFGLDRGGRCERAGARRCRCG